MSTNVLASVLARLKLLTATESDAELSRALAISPQTLSSWKVRDSVPYSLCIDVARQYACSLDWLLLGEPEHHRPRLEEDGWESDMLARLRTLSLADRQAVLLLVEDKQRIQQLERQLNALTSRLPDTASG
ncbi:MULTISPECIES: helix-turn-helix domain-containing protein [unclassified Pseudomonas]|uniref:helix-turn-helix domain-containing protein n=1 Tax=unclassified Pseudomonas TaxID=196821 RepID=UPI000A1FD2DF|nr:MULTISPECIES: helix-turn-helix domain-containing protein [unclassified Pseudomonas]WGV21079.1 helix-turn-helix domain-containing protein [Pseudomonas putida]